MEVSIAKAWKGELEKKVSELLKEYEQTTGLQPESIGFIRRPVHGDLGVENDYNYIVEVRVSL